MNTPCVIVPVLSVVLLSVIGGAEAAVIEFNVPDQDLPYSEDGFTLTTATSEPDISGGELTFVVSGDSATSVLTRDGGGTFDLVSFYYRIGGAVDFAAHTVSSDLGDLVTLSDGPTEETIVLNWVGVSEISFNVVEFSDSFITLLAVDDITVNATIPEPASLTLLALTGCALVRRRPARRS